MRSLLWPLVLLAVLLSGCASQPVSNSGDASTSAAENFDLDSFEGLGKALEQSMTARDGSLFLHRLDVDKLARRSLASLGVPAVKKKSVDSYAKTLQTILDKRFTETFSSVKSAHFIHLLPNDTNPADEAVALIRIEPEGGGISYWKVYLQRVNGRVSIVDWLNYSVGDTASHAIGDFSLRVGIAIGKPDSKDGKAVKAYLAAAQSGDPQQLVDAYEQLPQGMKDNALMIYAYLQAAGKLSIEAHQTALSSVVPRYSKNASYALLLVDYYQANEEYDKAHQAVDRAATELGADAGLDGLHAGIALNAGDYKRSIGYARDGISREATYLINYWTLLDALVFSENYDDAVLVLNILEDGFGYEFDTEQMATLEGYEAFSESAPFINWRTAALEYR